MLPSGKIAIVNGADDLQYVANVSPAATRHHHPAQDHRLPQKPVRRVWAKIFKESGRRRPFDAGPDRDIAIKDLLGDSLD